MVSLQFATMLAFGAVSATAATVDIYICEHAEWRRRGGHCRIVNSIVGNCRESNPTIMTSIAQVGGVDKARCPETGSGLGQPYQLDAELQAARTLC